VAEKPKVEQRIRWRIPHTSPKFRGNAEVVISTIESRGGAKYIDIRIRRTPDHPRGEGWTQRGMRLLPDQALSLSKALPHILKEWEDDD
jgi:hypothetical protein